MTDTMLESDRERDIVARRFGRRHSKPCNNPNILTCALWECQVADECRESPLVAQWREHDASNVVPFPAAALSEDTR